MAVSSGIEWTEATWNPTTGCSKVSSGCTNCYAEILSRRLKTMGLEKYSDEFTFRQHTSELDRPLHWKKPRRIFVNSMSDMFHEDADPKFITKCFETMLEGKWHTYQILTKRPKIMAQFSKRFQKYFGRTIPGHIWMGTSVENNAVVERIDDLRRVKCGIRFVSFEPLLEGIKDVDLNGIHWAIIGGESGTGFRPIDGKWIRDLIQQCQRQHVKIFFKQWGGIRPKSGGREIDGRTYSEYPVSPV